MFLNDLDDMDDLSSSQGSDTSQSGSSNRPESYTTTSVIGNIDGQIHLEGSSETVVVKGDDTDITDTKKVKNEYIVTSSSQEIDNEIEVNIDDVKNRTKKVEHANNYVKAELDRASLTRKEKDGKLDEDKGKDTYILYQSGDQLNEKWINHENQPLPTSNPELYKEALDSSFEEEYGGKSFFLYDPAVRMASGVGYGVFDVVALEAFKKALDGLYPIKVTCEIWDMSSALDTKSTVVVEDIKRYTNLVPSKTTQFEKWKAAEGDSWDLKKSRYKSREEVTFYRTLKYKELKNLNSLASLDLISDPLALFNDKEVSFFQLYEKFMTYTKYRANIKVELYKKRFILPRKLLATYLIKNVKVESYTLKNVTIKQDNVEEFTVSGNVEYVPNKVVALPGVGEI